MKVNYNHLLADMISMKYWFTISQNFEGKRPLKLFIKLYFFVDLLTRILVFSRLS